MKFTMRLAAFCLLAVLAGFTAIASSAELLDEKPRIAVVSAFPPEWIALQAELTESAEHTINGRKFITGKLGGKDVVLFLSGVSMVNAAMTTQSALDQFVITSVIFSGIAGGVDPALNIGDVVVAEQWGQYLEAVFARKTADGYAIPPFMAKDRVRRLRHDRAALDQRCQKGRLRRRRRNSGSRATPACSMQRARSPQNSISRIARRRTNASRNRRRSSSAATACRARPSSTMPSSANTCFRPSSAKVLDMESAAVAHVTYANGVPFLAVRSLSDLAGGGEGANEMMTFMALASKNSASVVKALLAEMP